MAFNGPNFLHRIGRRLFWSDPAFYRPIGLLRGRGDIFSTSYDLWIEGFPRSANTFAVKSFVAANPTAVVRGHRHIPAFVIQAVRDGKPGMLMLRKPEDATLSWAIFWRDHVGDCLDYYVDFHRPLLPYLSSLFVAPFEEVTSRFDAVVNRFNRTFATRFEAIAHNAETQAHRFAEMDRDQMEWRGFVDECRVPRPSPERAAIKREIRKALRESPTLSQKLQRANALYRALAPANPQPVRNSVMAGTQELPTCV